MPFKYKIFQQQTIIVVQAENVIDIHSCIQAMRDVVMDNNFDPQFNIIVDLRKMDYDPSTSELFQIRDSLNALYRHFKGKIILVTTKEILYLAKVVCLLAEIYNIRMSAVNQYNGLDNFTDQM